MANEQDNTDLIICSDGRPMRVVSSGGMTILKSSSAPRRQNSGSRTAPKPSPQRIESALVQPKPAKAKSRRDRRKSRDEVRPKPVRQFKPSKPKPQPTNWSVDDWEDDGTGIRLDQQGQVTSYSEPDTPNRLNQEDLFRAVERYPEYRDHWSGRVNESQPKTQRLLLRRNQRHLSWLNSMKGVSRNSEVRIRPHSQKTSTFQARLPLAAEPVRVETGHQIQLTQPHRLDRSEDLGTVQLIDLELDQASCFELQLSQVPNHTSLDEFLGWCPLPDQDGVEDPFLPISVTDDQTPLLWEIYPSGLS